MSKPGIYIRIYKNQLYASLDMVNWQKILHWPEGYAHVEYETPPTETYTLTDFKVIKDDIEDSPDVLSTRTNESVWSR